jgi:RNA polymerase sigma-70 factor (ECF subfamily)
VAAEPPTRDDDPAESADRWTAEALRGPLAAALAALHVRDRDVLLLFAWGQLGYDEIAAVLDVPVGTVRSRLHRARRQTRAVLGPASPLEEPR